MSNPIHPDDLEFHALASGQFLREFQVKFTESAEAHYKLGPFKDAPGRIANIKQEVLDQWAYVVRLEQRDREIAKRLHAFIVRVPLSQENRDELEDILGEVMK